MNKKKKSPQPSGFREASRLLSLKLPPEIIDEIADAEVTGFSLGITDETARECQTKIENKFGQRAVSASEIFNYFLEKSDGNLSQAIQQTTGFFKHTTRGQEDGVHWLSDHVMDEYSDYAPYDTLYPKDDPRASQIAETYSKVAVKVLGRGKKYKPSRAIDQETSLYNQTGKPYHAAHLVHLLSKFSPEMIMFMTGMEYAQHGPEQGVNKLLADVRILSELHKIRDNLRQYTTPKQ